MIGTRSLKALYAAYDGTDETRNDILQELKYQLEKCKSEQATIAEKVTSSNFDVTAERTKMQQLLEQINVKIQEQIVLCISSSIVNFDSNLETLLNEYNTCEFNLSGFQNNNFTTPNVLDVNIWIRSGQLATPLNDMIWRGTRRYEVGDIIICFLDEFLHLKNYTHKTSGATESLFQFAKYYNQFQGKYVQPVMFCCIKEHTNQFPFNTEWGMKGEDKIIPYYAVDLAKIVYAGTPHLITYFNTKYFTNNEYWMCITHLWCQGGYYSNPTQSAGGNFKTYGQLPYANAANAPETNTLILPQAYLAAGGLNANYLDYYSYGCGTQIFLDIDLNTRTIKAFPTNISITGTNTKTWDDLYDFTAGY